VVTVLAVIELLVFMGVTAPGFKTENFMKDAYMGGLPGICAAIPFAIWFYLAIEGVAMSAEEVKNPKKVIPRAYISGIVTLVVLALGVMVFAGGVGDWKLLSNMNSPLPEAMATVVGKGSGLTHMLVYIGLFGIIASFHGIILGYSRQIYALARAGFLPAVLGKVNQRFKTPHWALISGGVVGIIAVLAGAANQLITIAAMGAIVMYIISMVSLMVLRKTEPKLDRPFRAPVYPLFPIIAMVIAAAALIAMVWFNPVLAAIFAGMFLVGWIYYRLTHKQRAAAPFDDMIEAPGLAIKAAAGAD
jgi:ethanolamine permease